MLTVFRNKKQFLLQKENRVRILKEIDELINKLENTGIFPIVKNYEHGYYIKLIVDKSIIGVDLSEQKYSSLPDVIPFLMIVDYSFPKEPPKILCKENFCFPNLMDGRNLSSSVILKWDPSMSLYSVALTLPRFVKKVLTADGYEYYGHFSVGAVYDLKNFNDMLVNCFQCRIDRFFKKKKDEKNNIGDIPLFNDDEGDFTLVISDDSFVLLKHFETNKNMGKIVFWASLFSIEEMQINKNDKVVRLHFFSDDKKRHNAIQIRLKIDEILYFRETLVKRMQNLKVKIDASKLSKGQSYERRLTNSDIKKMSIEQIENYIAYFLKKIEGGEINFYIVNMFSHLSGKAIEYFNANDNEKENHLLKQLKTILSREDVQEIMKKSM